MLSILSIPVHSGLEALGEGGFLLPAQVTKFLSVDRVAAIIKGPVLGMRYPIVGFREPEFLHEFRAESQVRYFIRRANVVDLTNEPLVKDGVEGISSIASEEVTARMLPIPVEYNLLPSLEKTREFWDDLYDCVSRRP